MSRKASGVCHRLEFTRGTRDRKVEIVVLWDGDGERMWESLSSRIVEGEAEGKRIFQWSKRMKGKEV